MRGSWRNERFVWVVTLLIGILAVCVGIAAFCRIAQTTVTAVNPTVIADFPTILIDAGHGGVDGGAVAPDGTVEKGINLQIAQKTQQWLELFGYSTVMTRTEDELISDKDATTIRQKKSTDLKNRAKLFASLGDALLISIHQNKYSESKYYGAQTFYSKNDPQSKILAQSVQDSVVAGLQPENLRAIKASGSEIYLLNTAKKPAVMVECGFLSNPGELCLLKDSDYQSKMSFCIFGGIVAFPGSEASRQNLSSGQGENSQKTEEISEKSGHND